MTFTAAALLLTVMVAVSSVTAMPRQHAHVNLGAPFPTGQAGSGCPGAPPPAPLVNKWVRSFSHDSSCDEVCADFNPASSCHVGSLSLVNDEATWRFMYADAGFDADYDCQSGISESSGYAGFPQQSPYIVQYSADGGANTYQQFCRWRMDSPGSGQAPDCTTGFLPPTGSPAAVTTMRRICCCSFDGNACPVA